MTFAARKWERSLMHPIKDLHQSSPGHRVWVLAKPSVVSRKGRSGTALYLDDQLELEFVGLFERDALTVWFDANTVLAV